MIRYLVLFCSTVGVLGLEPCLGDTRGDRRCNKDPTHRVCAKIGTASTSFWHFTGQPSWCNTVGHYGGAYGSQPRCPASQPTWCICKWALAKWIHGEGCDRVEIDCGATDVCNLRQSYVDYTVDLTDARACVEQKCAAEWRACGEISIS